MTRPKDTEAIRRGFNILSMVSRAPLSIKDVHGRLKLSGISVSKRTIEKDLKRLPEEFPQMIEVDMCSIGGFEESFSGPPAGAVNVKEAS